jgi:hypothetical protein
MLAAAALVLDPHHAGPVASARLDAHVVAPAPAIFDARGLVLGAVTAATPIVILSQAGRLAARAVGAALGLGLPAFDATAGADLAVAAAAATAGLRLPVTASAAGLGLLASATTAGFLVAAPFSVLGALALAAALASFGK